MLINYRLGIAWRMNGWLAVYRQVSWLQRSLTVKPRADRPPSVPMHLPAKRCTRAPPCYPLVQAKAAGVRAPACDGGDGAGEHDAWQQSVGVPIWTPCASHQPEAAAPKPAPPPCLAPPPCQSAPCHRRAPARHPAEHIGHGWHLGHTASAARLAGRHARATGTRKKRHRWSRAN